jgi:hypothetical protein
MPKDEFLLPLFGEAFFMFCKYASFCDKSCDTCCKITKKNRMYNVD